MVKYTVCSLDVWGNAEDGYEVNDSFRIGSIEIDQDCSDLKVIETLIDAGYLDSCAMELAEVECSDEHFIHIRQKSDTRPVLNLFLDT